jgi:hypothetical protein
MKHLLALAAAAVLSTGCATVPGGGDYLQVLTTSGQVIWEMNTRLTGHQSCANIASQTYIDPGFSFRCASAPTDSPLPYTYTARFQDAESFRPSVPFHVRTFTSGHCWHSLTRDTMSPKTIILENNCNKM